MRPGHWRDELGLRLPQQALLRTLAVLLAVTLVAQGAVQHIAHAAGAQRVGPWLSWYILLPWCQVLNEEMVFRALLLGCLERRGLPRALVSLLSALAFVVGHVVIYRWGIAHVWLLPQTVVTLFAFALFTNSLYLRTRHIGYPAAIHLGWNLARFTCFWQFDNVASMQAEAYGFNTFEAHPAVMSAALLACAVTFGLQQLYSPARDCLTTSSSAPNIKVPASKNGAPGKCSTSGRASPQANSWQYSKGPIIPVTPRRLLSAPCKRP